MSLLLRQTSTRSIQLQLRPRAAGIAHPPSQRRLHFAAAFDHVTTVTAQSISSVHSAGLPWYITIPLVAVGVNFAARLPLQYYTRQLVTKRRELAPLAQAWLWRHVRNVGDEPMVVAASEAKKKAEIKRRVMKSQGRIFKTFGVQRWKSFLPFTTIVPFVLVSESLRRLCGVSVKVAGVPIGEAVDSSTGNALVSLSRTVDAVFDPSLAQGGLLWFADLTAVDPYYGLPLLCSAVLAAGSWGKMTKERLRELLSISDPDKVTTTDRVTTLMQRLLLLVPLLPIILSHLPSAIFLYWLTNFSLTHVNDWVLTRLISEKVSPLQAPRPSLPKVRPYLPATYPSKSVETGKQSSAGSAR